MVNTIMLTISLGNQMSFVDLSSTLSDPIEDPLTPYEIYSFEWINECLYTVDLHGVHFGLYGSKPLIRVGPLHDIHVGDQTLLFSSSSTGLHLGCRYQSVYPTDTILYRIFLMVPLQWDWV